MDDMSNRALLERLKQLEARVAALEREPESEPAGLVERAKESVPAKKPGVFDGVPE